MGGVHQRECDLTFGKFDLYSFRTMYLSATFKNYKYTRNVLLHNVVCSGSPIISGLRYDNSEAAMFCISSRQLVESVSWLKDGTVIEQNSVVQTQRIVDREDVTYEHKLKGNLNFVGRFTCIVRDGYGRSAERTLMLNG